MYFTFSATLSGINISTLIPSLVLPLETIQNIPNKIINNKTNASLF